MERDRSDVCIIGAGPAGAAAAIGLAAAGVPALLLDRARFPRDKVCGEGISPRAIRILQALGLYRPEVFSRFCRIEGVRIRSPGGHVLEVSLKGDPEVGDGYVVPRKVFDRFLLEAALDRGAKFWDDCEIHELKPGREDILILGTRGGHPFSIRAQYAVAAWGAQPGRLAKQYHPCPRQGRFSAVAVRAHFEGIQGFRPFMEIHFDPDLVPGYGWVFPTGPASANIGYGMRLDCLLGRGASLRGLFHRFLETNPDVMLYVKKATQVSPLRGARIPFRRLFQPVAKGRVLLAGDAAGLADPLSGEGIGTALHSGLLAARCISRALGEGARSAATARSYASACRKEINRDLFCAYLLQSLLVKPRFTSTGRLLDLLVGKAQQNPRMARAMARLIIGDLPKDVILHAEPWRKLFRALRGP